MSLSLSLCLCLLCVHVGARGEQNPTEGMPCEMFQTRHKHTA